MKLSRNPEPIMRIRSSTCGRLTERVHNAFEGSADCQVKMGLAIVRAGSDSAGFSLIEIVCAVLVLAIALTGMVQGVTTALSSTKESELQTVAALFAAGQVETLRAEGDFHDGTTQGECGEGLSLYRWQQTLSPAGIDGLHEVTVVIENAKSGKSIYELKTLLFEMPSESPQSSSRSRRESSSKRDKKTTR
jgi:prepilin-type N-terminal cleavage/methylation domain-containing protein